MAPPLYPKMVSTPSSASTCTIMSAPFMVAPARGCFLAAGSARLSFEDDIGSPSGDPWYTLDPARLRRSAGIPDRRRSHDRERPLGVARPQQLLVELADARLRHLVDEAPALGDPPSGDALGEERLERVRARAGAGPRHHAGERPLLPARVGHTHHRGLE